MIPAPNGWEVIGWFLRQVWPLIAALAYVGLILWWVFR